MKLLLTSFGSSHLTSQLKENGNMFYRMPPVSMSRIGKQFLPDYVTLLLADKIIIDSQTYEKLITKPNQSYDEVAVMIQRLYDEGFVQVEDFDSIILNNKIQLEAMLERDLKDLTSWVTPLKESISYWRNFTQNFYGELKDDYMKSIFGNSPADLHSEAQILWHTHSAHLPPELSYSSMLDEALNSSAKRKRVAYRQLLKNYLTGYLSYINANILLSQELETGFHDWYDFKPFYHEKFSRIAQNSSPGGEEIDNVKKLFEISFPEFAFWQPENIIKALKDKRITELRQLIDSACKGEVEFDKDFANRTLHDVFKIEAGMTKSRNIVSYGTIPLSFIPVVGDAVQKLTEEVINSQLEKKKKKGFQWFYMISDLASKR